MQAARSSRALRAEPRGGAPRARSGLSLAVSAQQRRSSGAAPSASASAAAAAAASAAAAGASRDYFATDRRPVILFDGVCNLCNTGVNIVLDWDTAAAFRLAALQSPAGRALLARCGRSPDDISSIVLVEPERCYTKSEAVRRIGARLGLPFPLLAALAQPVPGPLRDFLYDQVAANRYNLFGRSDACRLGNADKLAARFIVE